MTVTISLDQRLMINKSDQRLINKVFKYIIITHGKSIMAGAQGKKRRRRRHTRGVLLGYFGK